MAILALNFTFSFQIIGRFVIIFWKYVFRDAVFINAASFQILQKLKTLFSAFIDILHRRWFQPTPPVGAKCSHWVKIILYFYMEYLMMVTCSRPHILWVGLLAPIQAGEMLCAKLLQEIFSISVTMQHQRLGMQFLLTIYF